MALTWGHLPWRIKSLGKLEENTRQSSWGPVETAGSHSAEEVPVAADSQSDSDSIASESSKASSMSATPAWMPETEEALKNIDWIAPVHDGQVHVLRQPHIGFFPGG